MKAEKIIVWIAYRGEYSDRHAVGVFSSEEKLKEYLTEVTGKSTGREQSGTEEWELDALIPPPGLHSYNVAMTREGDILHVSRAFKIPEEDSVKECHLRDLHYFIVDYCIPPGSPNTKALKTMCWARNEDHAVKIAGERRIAYLTLQQVTVPA